jgi:hypothetical protein
MLTAAVMDIIVKIHYLTVAFGGLKWRCETALMPKNLFSILLKHQADFDLL